MRDDRSTRSTHVDRIGRIEVLKLVRQSEDVRGHAAEYRVRTPSGRTFEFTEGQRSRAWESKRKRALVWAELWHRTGGTTITATPETVPVNVAKRGTAAIAAYLFSAHSLTSETIAEELGIAPKTVKQYVNDVANRRR